MKPSLHLTPEDQQQHRDDAYATLVAALKSDRPVLITSVGNYGEDHNPILLHIDVLGEDCLHSTHWVTGEFTEVTCIELNKPVLMDGVPQTIENTVKHQSPDLLRTMAARLRQQANELEALIVEPTPEPEPVVAPIEAPVEVLADWDLLDRVAGKKLPRDEDGRHITFGVGPSHETVAAVTDGRGE